MKDKHVTECDCGTHLVHTQYDEELKLFYMAMYTYGHFSMRRTIWNRIRFAFYHLFTGRLYDDQIVLSNHEARKLAKFLMDRTYEED